MDQRIIHQSRDDPTLAWNHDLKLRYVGHIRVLAWRDGSHTSTEAPKEKLHGCYRMQRLVCSTALRHYGHEEMRQKQSFAK